MLLRSQTQDFDHNRWLFETKGTYGIGNACWQEDHNSVADDQNSIGMSDFLDKPWKPLTRKVNISGGIISPYRLLVIFRIVILAFFLSWRIRNPNYDAMWLWGMSIVCEIWFAISWLLDVLPKMNPINRAADLAALHDKFEQPSPSNPTGRSDLPGIDVFVSTADPEKEPPLVTANTILSILGVEYPIEKVSCYISDDGGAILTFEAMAEAVKFAELWVPFCRKHNIEPRNPDAYFSIKKDPTKNKKRPDFVKDRRWMKREYDEFKVRINGLPEAIKKRSEMYNAREEKKEREEMKAKNGGVAGTEDQPLNVPKATWMADGTHWPGTWYTPCADHSKGDHAGILQVMSKVPEHDPVMGYDDEKTLDFTGVDIRIPMFAYVSREKRPGFDHNKKAGAMNAMVRASAVLSNGPFILNLDCDHYVYNSIVLREGMCYMMDRGGDRVCYIQFPQRFEGIDPSDRYANHNTVFFDGNMRALDGLQGPMYVGTGCMFRRYALYGFEPPRFMENNSESSGVPQKFGNSSIFTDTIPIAEFQARPLADHKSVKNGRPPGELLKPRPPMDAPTVAEAIAVISCWYEDKTEWGDRVGWIYGSVTEDVVTGYRMHNRGWRSIYLSLFSGQFIVQGLDVTFLFYLLSITVCLILISLLEVKWSGIALEEWWRNEQFWVIGGTSSHLVAVLQGLLKVIAGVEIHFTLTSKSAGEDEEDVYADLYLVKWTSLFIMPLTIIIINLIAVIMGILRTVYSVIPQWNKLFGGLFFSFWVLSHMYPFAKGLMGRKGKVPTIVYVWSGLLSITIALLWISLDPPGGTKQEG
ncbi:hypothetical protein Ahy_B04g070466 isoform A [Arachis hypogaea]|uniref:Cellulose synthase-like protein n=1 Tax=Arachis hypogaea TaxID=3818 RepID=A0A444ZHB3_ARAHY|nr:hypothetical protein Ahy_B04g070466 isoform A [Arachis hypogaea]